MTQTHSAAERTPSALRNRLIFGTVMLAGLLVLLALDELAQRWSGVGGIGLLAILLIVLPPAVIELGTLFAAERIAPYRLLSAAGAAALALHAFATQFISFNPFAAATFACIVVFVMLSAALRHAMSRQTQEAIRRMAGTMLAMLYLGGLAWFLMALRVHNVLGHTMIIVWILLVVKFTDIGAYFGGRALGRHKLILWLSPGKTWEGLFFGLLTAGAIGAVFGTFLAFPLPWWKGFIAGVVIGAIGQLGDLLESLMKRDAEVKDSGDLIPGFGGVLDVIDSPLVAAPFAYLLFNLI